jgi:protein ImuB
MFAAVHAPSGPDLARLVQCAADFSPYVEETSPDTVVISIDGLAHLFGSLREIAVAIARRAADRGLAAHVAIAENPDLAVHGARGFPGVTVMEPGREAGLPVAILEPREEIAFTLALWGIRTFGEFAALPEDGVAERLGAEGVRLQKLARGAGSRPLVPVRTAPPFEESIELEHPLSLLEPLSFLLGRLLHDLCARLESRGLAAHELKLSLTLEGANPHERTLRLPYPMRAAGTFLKLLSLDLEMHPPGAPVTAVSLAAEPVNPRVVQHGLFIPLAPEPQKLELTLARIAKLVGEGNAGSPRLLDMHRPRAWEYRGQYTLSPRGQSVLSTLPSPRFSLRLFRPPLHADVEASDGRPARVAARGVRGRVLESAGPWRTSGGWWREDAWSRDEWDVALSDGALYLLYRDRRGGEWFVEGTYD